MKASVRIGVTKAYAELVLASAQLKYSIEDTLLHLQMLEVAEE